MRNPFKAFSLQVTFFTSFILISSFLIALLGITGYYITNQEVVDKTISSRILLLDEINKQLDLQLQSIEYDSLVVASNPAVIQYLQQHEASFERIGQNSSILDMLSRHSYVKEGIHSVQLYAKNSSTNTYVGANGIFTYDFLKNTTYYDRIQNSDYVWLGAHYLEIGDFVGRPAEVVSFIRKVLSPTGDEVGFLIFNIKLSYMHELMSSRTADGGRYILDSNRRLIMESSDNFNGHLAYDTIEQPLRSILQGTNDSASHAIADWKEKQLVIWNKQSRTQWISVDIISWEHITQGSKRIQNAIILASVLCVAFAVIMAYLLSRQFVKPIQKLVKSMNRLKTGHLATQVENDYKNEIGYLNQNFNEMTMNIKDLITQLNEQNKRKREAELQVLQEQMNPHFLYNTLDMMNWHAIESGSGDISRMLSLLGKMLRIGLSSGATFIPLSREMEHLQCYVELQQIRYQNHIQFHLDVPEELRMYFVPKLTLQPFVENSIIHGFHSRRQGNVHIRAWEDQQTIYISIEDDGYGMETDKLSASREHHGLRNVRERFDLYFGPPYGVQVESSPGAGTKITLSLPKLLSEPTDLKQLEEAE